MALLTTLARLSTRTAVATLRVPLLHSGLEDDETMASLGLYVRLIETLQRQGWNSASCHYLQGVLPA